MKFVLDVAVPGLNVVLAVINAIRHEEERWAWIHSALGWLCVVFIRIGEMR